MVKTYEDFKKEVFTLSKIDLNSYKERQMKRRIESLIQKRGFNNYDEYYKALKTQKDVYKEFLNFITINVSEFFRNPLQWDILQKEILPELIKKSKNGLKIWSAACSTGQEPYTLAMMLSKHLPLNKMSIIATDIDDQVLAKAKEGRYNEKLIEGIPTENVKKFMKKEGNDYVVSNDIKKCITFKQHNLLKDKYPSDMDLIVCRNVLIYFTEEAKDGIYKRFNDALRHEGILFVGSTEQIIRCQRYNFKTLKTFFYQKDN